MFLQKLSWTLTLNAIPELTPNGLKTLICIQGYYGERVSDLGSESEEREAGVIFSHKGSKKNELSCEASQEHR